MGSPSHSATDAAFDITCGHSFYRVIHTPPLTQIRCHTHTPYSYLPLTATDAHVYRQACRHAMRAFTHYAPPTATFISNRTATYHTLTLFLEPMWEDFLGTLRQNCIRAGTKLQPFRCNHTPLSSEHTQERTLLPHTTLLPRTPPFSLPHTHTRLCMCVCECACVCIVRTLSLHHSLTPAHSHIAVFPVARTHRFQAKVSTPNTPSALSALSALLSLFSFFFLSLFYTLIQNSLVLPPNSLFLSFCPHILLITHSHTHLLIHSLHREPWLFPEQNRDAISQAIRTRYSYLPYIYTLFYQTYVSSLPLSFSLSLALTLSLYLSITPPSLQSPSHKHTLLTGERCTSHAPTVG